MKKFHKLLFTVIVITVIATAVGFTASAAEIAFGAATVSANTLNVRSSPSTDSKIVTTLSENDIVVILEKTNKEWYYINYHGSVGYVNVPYLTDILEKENFNAVAKVTGDSVNMRETPATSAKVLGTYSGGTEMTVIGINCGWYKVKYDGKTGYMRSDFMEIISGYQSAVSRSVSAATKETGNKLVDYALSYVGSRYVYGGSSPSGFDCSGFTSYVYKNFGYSISRTATQQYNNNGYTVSKSELIPGDLVFFSSNGKYITHVGIYIGEDEFVHASTSSAGVIISRLDSTYYTRAWYGAKRVA